MEITYQLVPQYYWDDPGGPVGHELSEGTVYLYRIGSFKPEFEVAAGDPVLVPPGDWVWVAQAPGWVSTFSSKLRISSTVRGRQKTSIVPVVPACLVVPSDDRRWHSLDRVDFVSLSESAVYPVGSGPGRAIWIPQGAFLAYGVEGGRLVGFTDIHRCGRDPVEIGPPEPPASELQSLMVTASVPSDLAPRVAMEASARLEPGNPFSLRPPVSPTASLWQGTRVAYFFLDVPADEPLDLTMTHPELRTRIKPLSPLGGSTREVAVQPLARRRSLELLVNYQPSRDHGVAELILLACGPDQAERPAALLYADCAASGEPLALLEGLEVYRFEDLDDGHYVVSARIDDEELPGLGQEISLFLDPGTDGLPEMVGPVDLLELEVYGRLLGEGGEAVPGFVEVEPWKGTSGIPQRRIRTNEDLEYHLSFFARYPRRGEIRFFPQALQSEEPSDLPGLYCCFVMRACSEDGACRTFNGHSRITGSGEFDIELPGSERVELRVVDAQTGEAVPDAEILVRPTPAFHFVWGDVLWREALGLDPDVLRAEETGRLVWIPPNPGEHVINALSPGYESGKVRVRVAEGSTTEAVIELEPRGYSEGVQLVFEDGQPVAGVVLVAFGEDGEPRAACNVPTDEMGFASVPKGCETSGTYLLVHPRASLQTLSSEELSRSAQVVARLRSRAAPRILLVDGDGEPLPETWLQLRMGGLVVTPDVLAAGGRAGRPFRLVTNASGEAVLYGLEVDRGPMVEVSAWRPYESSWVQLTSGSGVHVEVPVELAR